MLDIVQYSNEELLSNRVCLFCHSLNPLSEYLSGREKEKVKGNFIHSLFHASSYSRCRRYFTKYITYSYKLDKRVYVLDTVVWLLVEWVSFMCPFNSNLTPYFWEVKISIIFHIIQYIPYHNRKIVSSSIMFWVNSCHLHIDSIKLFLSSHKI